MFTLRNLPGAPLITADRLSNLFDPKKNKLFALGADRVTFGFFLNTMKDFYTSQENRDAIHQYYDYNEFAGMPGPGISIRDLWDYLPENLKWLLPLCITFDGIKVYKREIVLKATEGHLIVQNNNPNAYAWKKEIRENPDLAVRYKFFVDYLTQVDEQVKGFLYQHGSKKLTAFGHLPFLHQFWSCLFAWCQNSRNFHLYGTDGDRNDTVRPSEIPNDFVSNGTFFGYRGDTNITWENRRKLYRVYNYTTNVLSYFKPKRLEGEANNVPLCGVELELSTDYGTEALIDACDDPFFMIKSDASVRGNKDYMYELVTAPMSFLAQKVYWSQFFDNLDYRKFDTSLETTNGMHVHVDNHAFKNAQHQKAFIYFWLRPQHTEFFLKFSARDLESFKRYSGVPKDMQGDTEAALLDDPNSFMDRLRDDAGRPLRGIVTKSKKGGTTEVRLFRGVVSLADMVKNLEMVEAVFEFTKSAETHNDLDLKAFLNFVYGQPADTWEVLKEYINTLDLEYCLHFSEVRALFIGETRTDRIVQNIINSNLKLNDVHITCLNLYFGRNLFTYTNGQIKVRPMDTKASAVAKFDGTVAAKYNKKKPIKNLNVPNQPAPPPPPEHVAVDDAVPAVRPWQQFVRVADPQVRVNPIFDDFDPFR